MGVVIIYRQVTYLLFIPIALKNQCYGNKSDNNTRMRSFR